MKSIQIIAGFILCGLLLCASNGLTLAAKVNTPLTLSSASGTGVYLYNPASRTIVCPLDYSNELIMIPWQDYNTSMMWNVYSDNSGYYISAIAPTAAGCASGVSAFWNGLQGSAVSTLCASEAAATSFHFGTGAKSGNYIIYAGNAATGYNSNAECVTIVNGVPTVPSSACNTLTAATQWQLVTIS